MITSHRRHFGTKCTLDFQYVCSVFEIFSIYKLDKILTQMLVCDLQSIQMRSNNLQEPWSEPGHIPKGAIIWTYRHVKRRTNGWTEIRKLYTPRHSSGYHNKYIPGLVLTNSGQTKHAIFKGSQKFFCNLDSIVTATKCMILEVAQLKVQKKRNK